MSSNPFSIQEVKYPLADAFSESVACFFRIEQISADHFDDHGIDMPEKIKKSVWKRQCEFLAGRICAKKAMTKLNLTHLLSTGPMGNPLWPNDLQGSITHSKNFAAAMIGKINNYYIGIDSEEVFSRKESIESILSLVINKKDFFTLLSSTKLNHFQLATLIFSAKESVYKCLFPIVNEFFDFSYVSVLEIKTDTLIVAVTSDCFSEIKKGTLLNIFYKFENEYVHTKCVFIKNSFKLD